MSSGINYDWVYYYTVCTGVGDDETCTDHYQYICEGDPPPIDEEVIDFIDPGDGGGGGGSSSDGIKTTTLTPDQKAQLQEAIDKMDNKCGFKAIYNKIMTEGNVEIRLGAENVAAYQPNSKEILYNEDYPQYVLINDGTLAHELFHAYQHQIVYGTQFTNLSSNHINIEFEQIVFQDIVRRISDGPFEIGSLFTETHESGFADAHRDYRDWIDQLTSDGASYPDLNSISGFDNVYSSHLAQFKIFGHPGYTSADIIPGFLPSALKQLYNGMLNCSN